MDARIYLASAYRIGLWAAIFATVWIVLFNITIGLGSAGLPRGKLP